MSKPVVRLVTKTADAASEVREKFETLLSRVTEEDYTAMAVVLIRHDGTVFVSRMANGNRTMLLGAVADLQYTIAKDGDEG